MKRILLWFVGLLACSSASAWAQQQFKVLVLAVPNRYHSDYVTVAKPQLEALARRHDFTLVWAWNTRPFDEALEPYAAIVFLNTPGEELDAAQRQRFERYLRAGGGAVAVHRALIATPGQWPWFERLIGRPFRIHPMVQTAALRVLDRGFPATSGLPQRWIWTDEWYEFGEALLPDLHAVLAVDESSYDPTRIWPGQQARGMGRDHPVAWYHHYDGGRVFVTALGHTPELYSDARYLEHLYGGLWWAATGRGIDAH